MFISLISEFVVGFLSSNIVIRIDAFAGVVVIGASLISGVTLGAGELGELQIDELEERITNTESDIEVIGVTLFLLIDVISAGLASDGFTAVLEVILTLSNAISLTIDLLGALGRGLALFGLFGEDTGVIGSGLVVLEIISNILRPISLALRIFANLTSGVLISSLATSGVSAGGVGSLVAFVLGVNDVSLFVFIVVSIVLSAFETVVGIIQSYVYSILALQYGRGIRS